MLKLRWIDYSDHNGLLDLRSEKSSGGQCKIVVADLHSKKILKQTLLQRDGFIEGSQILRASELWRSILFQVEPIIAIVPKSLAIFLAKEFILQHSQTLGLKPSQAQSLVEAAIELAPIVFHPDGDERLEAWFEENPDRRLLWQLWFIRVKVFVNDLVTNKKIIINEWIPSYIIHFHDVSSLEVGPLIVDLAGSLSSAEMELFNILVQKNEIILNVPTGRVWNRFSRLLNVYSVEKKIQQQVAANDDLTLHSRGQFLRFANALAETKFVVAEIRRLLDVGVPISDIQIIMADPRAYRSVLYEHLRAEGIPCEANGRNVLRDRSDFQKFWSHIKMLLGQQSRSDVEVCLDIEDVSRRSRRIDALSPEKRNDFRSSHLMSRPNVGDEPIVFETRFTRWEFLQNLTHFIDEIILTPELLSSLIECFKGVPETISLSWKNWVEYLWEQSGKDCESPKVHQDHLVIVDLFGAIGTTAKYRYYMGLNEAALKGHQGSFLEEEDIFLLQKDLGFVFDSGRSERAEFALEWAAQGPAHLHCFLVSDVDFVGKLQMPCRFWLQHKLETVNKTSIADFMKTTEAPLTCFDDRIMNRSIHAALAIRDVAKVEWRNMPTLSQSSLKTFDDCSFRFYAEKFFLLENTPEIEHDLDRMSRGSLIHALLAFMAKQKTNWSWQFSELSEFAESWRTEYSSGKSHQGGRLQWELTWPFEKNRAIEQALEVQKLHNLRLQEYPRSSILGTEVKFNAFFNLETGMWLTDHECGFKDRSPHLFKLTGSIDRMDLVESAHANGEKYLYIWDYKGSLSASMKKSPNDWLANQDRQLLLYAWAVHKGFVDGLDAEKFRLGGIHYWSYFEDIRGYGVNIDSAAEAAALGISKTISWSQEEFKNQLEQLELQLLQLIRDIKTGEMRAVPQDPKICHNCLWRGLCRASHLK
jgi:RecB family exonuclease